MKACRIFELLLLKTVLFVVVVQLCFSSQAQPLASWWTVFSNTPAQLTGIAYGNGTFVGVGGGLDFISHDGSNWTAYSNPTFLYQAGVAYGNGKFVTYGTNAQNSLTYICTSTNGINWSTVFTNFQQIYNAAYGNSSWVFFTYSNAAHSILTATITSSNWNWTQVSVAQTPMTLSFINGFFVMEIYYNGSGDSIYTSSDGISWQYKSLSPMGGLNFISYGNGNYSFISDNGGNLWASTSSDLINWSPCSNFSIGGNVNECAVGYYGNKFVAVIQYYNSSLGTVATSTDGSNWQTNGTFTIQQGAYGTALPLAFGQGKFVTTTANQIYLSGVFYANTNPAPTTLSIATHPCVTINGTAGAVYQVQYNTNLINTNWLTLTNIMLPYSPYLLIDTSTTANGQRYYRTIQLQ